MRLWDCPGARKVAVDHLLVQLRCRDGLWGWMLGVEVKADVELDEKWTGLGNRCGNATGNGPGC